MDELIRIAMRHEAIFKTWGVHLNKDFARQRRTNRWFGFLISVLGGAVVVEDFNLYQTDKKLKELEKQIAELKKEEENQNSDNASEE